MIRKTFPLSLCLLCAVAGSALAQLKFDDLPSLLPGRTAAQNALWIENAPSLRFVSAKRVVVAEIEGPATITMLHFAMPGTLKLNRDVLLKIYWDGEKEPERGLSVGGFLLRRGGPPG